MATKAEHVTALKAKHPTLSKMVDGVTSTLNDSEYEATIDEWATKNGLDGEVESPYRLPPTEVEESPPLTMDFTNGGIKTIVWATGFRPDYSWLKVPVFDQRGRIRHDGGIVESPGLYLMGIQFLRRRKSVLLDGAGDDARDLSNHMLSYLDGQVATASH